MIVDLAAFVKNQKHICSKESGMQSLSLFDIVLSISSLVVILILGVLIVFFIVKVFSRFFVKSKNMEFLKRNNIATTILLFSIIISAAILCSGTFRTVYQAISYPKNVTEINARMVQIAAISGIGLLQVGFSVVVSVGIAFLSTKLFDLMTTGIEEYEEIINNNNISMGLLLGAIVIALTLFIQFPFMKLVSALMPLPEYGVPV